MGISFAGNVVGDGHARQLDDAALDGVHQRKIAHRPGEQRALGIAGTAQEKRRCGQVNNARDAELAVDGFEAGNPEARGFIVLLRLPSFRRPLALHHRLRLRAFRGSSGAPRR